MKVGDKKDRDLLIEGSQRMDLALSDQVIDQLMTYLNLVENEHLEYIKLNSKNIDIKITCQRIINCEYY